MTVARYKVTGPFRVKPYHNVQDNQASMRREHVCFRSVFDTLPVAGGTIWTGSHDGVHQDGPPQRPSTLLE
jgi:hypothetical protein